MRREKKREDPLAAVMKEVSPQYMERSARRDSRIEIRVTEETKQSISDTAAALGLNITEYLESLHKYALSSLNDKQEKTSYGSNDEG
jgi:predicted DNA binding CopG/RHH family protein